MLKNSKNKKGHLKNKKMHKVKKQNLFSILIIGAVFTLFFIFVFSSCSMFSTPSEKIDVVRNQEDKSISDEGSKGQPEETMGLEEEEVLQIDYQTAVAGADMVGAIPSFLCINRDNIIKIEITNTSDFTWRTERPGVVRIGYHYYGQDVEYANYDQTSRSSLPQPVNPGETVIVEVLINNIENEGTYVIQIDPVLEGNERPEDNFWFSSKGIEMIEGTVYFGSCGE
ncbi:MAG: hypothetical protein FJW69_02010 [Actinobacteria bacterium]|nr:hypothetical protein [Actinomycetota bacterium]MBM3713555.1 hypothetical protein [Actinomycetota bacterium]